MSSWVWFSTFFILNQHNPDLISNQIRAKRKEGKKNPKHKVLQTPKSEHHRSSYIPFCEHGGLRNRCVPTGEAFKVLSGQAHCADDARISFCGVHVFAKVPFFFLIKQKLHIHIRCTKKQPTTNSKSQPLLYKLNLNSSQNNLTLNM